MAQEAGEAPIAEDWTALARRGAAALQARLWDGGQYRVDTDGSLSTACFIGQLFGPFLASRCGLGDIVEPERARMALGTV